MLATVKGERLQVKEHIGKVFGSQPFLAIKTKRGEFFHDNFDFVADENSWYYTFDEQTILLSEVDELKVASAGLHGGHCVIKVL